MSADELIHRAVQPGHDMAEVFAAVAGLPAHERAQALDTWTGCCSTNSDPLKAARILTRLADELPHQRAQLATTYRRMATIAVGGQR